MPTYDYICKECSEASEFFQRISEGPKKKCPHCGKNGLERQITGGQYVIYKGPGFYKTDYRKDDPK